MNPTPSLAHLMATLLAPFLAFLAMVIPRRWRGRNRIRAGYLWWWGTGPPL